MIKELNHIGIRAGDFEKTLDFYQKTLGGTIIRDSRSLDGKAVSSTSSLATASSSF